MDMIDTFNALKKLILSKRRYGNVGSFFVCFVFTILKVMICSFSNVFSENGFELVASHAFWPDLFSQYFQNGGMSPDDSRDDMLFYIRKNPELKNRHGIIQVCIRILNKILIRRFKIFLYVHYFMAHKGFFFS